MIPSASVSACEAASGEVLSELFSLSQKPRIMRSHSSVDRAAKNELSLVFPSRAVTSTTSFQIRSARA